MVDLVELLLAHVAVLGLVDTVGRELLRGGLDHAQVRGEDVGAHEGAALAEGADTRRGEPRFDGGDLLGASTVDSGPWSAVVAR